MRVCVCMRVCVQDLRMSAGGCLRVGERYFWGSCGGGRAKVLFTSYSLEI